MVLLRIVEPPVGELNGCAKKLLVDQNGWYDSFIDTTVGSQKANKELLEPGSVNSVTMQQFNSLVSPFFLSFFKVYNGIMHLSTTRQQVDYQTGELERKKFWISLAYIYFKKSISQPKSTINQSVPVSFVVATLAQLIFKWTTTYIQ